VRCTVGATVLLHVAVGQQLQWGVDSTLLWHVMECNIVLVLNIVRGWAVASLWNGV